MSAPSPPDGDIDTAKLGTSLDDPKLKQAEQKRLLRPAASASAPPRGARGRGRGPDILLNTLVLDATHETAGSRGGLQGSGRLFLEAEDAASLTLAATNAM